MKQMGDLLVSSVLHFWLTALLPTLSRKAMFERTEEKCLLLDNASINCCILVLAI
jgi:hypothetical protein